MGMRKDAQLRIRTRIRTRLDELGMTARELARAVRQDAINEREADAWISGILHGRQGLSWKYFDAVADKLGWSPSELVRHDDAELRELTPSEMRLLKHHREWPRAIQDAWLDMLDHFAAAAPDRETAALLDKIRRTPKSVRRPTLAWLVRLLEEGIPPEFGSVGAEPGEAEVASASGATHRVQRAGKPRAVQLHRDDDQTARTTTKVRA